MAPEPWILVDTEAGSSACVGDSRTIELWAGDWRQRWTRERRGRLARLLMASGHGGTNLALKERQASALLDLSFAEARAILTDGPGADDEAIVAACDGHGVRLFLAARPDDRLQLHEVFEDRGSAVFASGDSAASRIAALDIRFADSYPLPDALSFRNLALKPFGEAIQAIESFFWLEINPGLDHPYLTGLDDPYLETIEHDVRGGDLDELANLLSLAVITDSRVGDASYPTELVIRAADLGHPAEIMWNGMLPATPRLERLLTFILSHIIPVGGETHAHGASHARHRTSGYRRYRKLHVLEFQDAPSAHQRLKARTALRQRLGALGLGETEIDRLTAH